MGKPRTRANGQGSIYKREDRNTWVAQIVTGWRPPNKTGGRMIPVKKVFGGFKTKKEAKEALNKIQNGETPVRNNVLLNEVFNDWKEFYKSRVTEKTLNGYVQAFNYFSDLIYRKIDTISAGELQACMDKCPKGKRTHQLMKVAAGLVWGYAKDENIVKNDITSNLYIGKHESKPREPLSPDDIKLIKEAVGKLRYAEYIYCMCYLGFRPGEFLEIRKSQVCVETIEKEKVYYIKEGKKTEAGRNRTVVIPKQILPYILERLWIPGTDLLFPFYYFHRITKKLVEFREMKMNYFEESVFKPITAQLGIEGKVPYSARHSYADKLKHAEGDVRDKAALIGHTDYNFTRVQYQSSPIEDLKAVVDSIE